MCRRDQQQVVRFRRNQVKARSGDEFGFDRQNVDDRRNDARIDGDGRMCRRARIRR